MNFVTDEDRNGLINPNEASLALEAGQLALFRHYYGEGRELTQVSSDALLPFTRSESLDSDAAGKLTLPDDYGHLRSFSAGGLRYTPALHTEIDEAAKSQLNPITQFPRFTYEAGGLQLYPAKLTTGTLHYYATPASPVIGYDGTSGEPVYDEDTSVQLTFAKKYWIEVVVKALPYVGVKLSNAEVFALSNEFTQKSPA